MFLDTTLLFSSYTTPVAVTVTGDSSIIDLTGAGVGNAPAMSGGQTNSGPVAIGLDVGAGDGVAIPSINVAIGTTFVGTGTTTMSISVKAAPQVSATNNAQGTYTTLATTGTFTTPPLASQLTAGSVINIPIPPIVLAAGELPPRFYKLSYTVTNGPMTAGTLSAAIVLNQPNIVEGSQFPKNFVSL